MLFIVYDMLFLFCTRTLRVRSRTHHFGCKYISVFAYFHTFPKKLCPQAALFLFSRLYGRFIWRKKVPQACCLRDGPHIENCLSRPYSAAGASSAGASGASVATASAAGASAAADLRLRGVRRAFFSVFIMFSSKSTSSMKHMSAPSL